MGENTLFSQIMLKKPQQNSTILVKMIFWVHFGIESMIKVNLVQTDGDRLWARVWMGQTF